MSIPMSNPPLAPDAGEALSLLDERIANYSALRDQAVNAGLDENGYALATEALEHVRHDLASLSEQPSSTGEWRTIETANRAIPSLVGCWVIDDEDYPQEARWSAWTVYPGEPLGEDGTWGDDPTHWQPLPTPPQDGGLG